MSHSYVFEASQIGREDLPTATVSYSYLRIEDPDDEEVFLLFFVISALYFASFAVSVLAGRGSSVKITLNH